MPGGTERYYPHFANLYRWLQVFKTLNLEPFNETYYEDLTTYTIYRTLDIM